MFCRLYEPSESVREDSTKNLCKLGLMKIQGVNPSCLEYLTGGNLLGNHDGDDDDDDGQELAQVLQKWTAASGRGSYELRHVLRLSVNTLHIVFFAVDSYCF